MQVLKMLRGQSPISDHPEALFVAVHPNQVAASLGLLWQDSINNCQDGSLDAAEEVLHRSVWQQYGSDKNLTQNLIEVLFSYMASFRLTLEAKAMALTANLFSVESIM